MDVLLQRALQCDPGAQRALVEKFQPMIDAFLRRVVGDGVRRHVSCSDIGQEVFARAFASLHTLPETATLEDFKRRLFRYTRWIVVDLARKGKNFVGESICHRPSRGGSERRSARRGFERRPLRRQRRTGTVTRSDEVAWVRKMSWKLPEKYRRVILLRLEGKTFSEVAEILGEDRQTIHKRYQRAGKKLATLLKVRGRKGV